MDIFSELAAIADANVSLERITSYARALKAAIKERSFEIEGMLFVHAGSPDEADMVHRGRHTMFFHLQGTEKLYRVMVEPVQETHK